MSLFSRVIDYVANLPEFATYIRRVHELLEEASLPGPEILKSKQTTLLSLKRAVTRAT